MPSLKVLSRKKELLTGGHRLCAGCGASIIVRQVLMATEDPVVMSAATGCLEVATTIYPFTAWRIPWIHCAFENSASTLSGVEAAYRSLKRQGKIDRTIKFIAFGGDGGTYDIGLQALSGVLERGHNLLYICYDNQAYMNCLSTSSLIMTEDGVKRITEVKEGDESTINQNLVGNRINYFSARGHLMLAAGQPPIQKIGKSSKNKDHKSKNYPLFSSHKQKENKKGDTSNTSQSNLIS